MQTHTHSVELATRTIYWGLELGFRDRGLANYLSRKLPFRESGRKWTSQLGNGNGDQQTQVGAQRRVTVVKGYPVSVKIYQIGDEFYELWDNW